MDEDLVSGFMEKIKGDVARVPDSHDKMLTLNRIRTMRIEHLRQEREIYSRTPPEKIGGFEDLRDSTNRMEMFLGRVWEEVENLRERHGLPRDYTQDADRTRPEGRTRMSKDLRDRGLGKSRDDDRER